MIIQTEHGGFFIEIPTFHEEQRLRGGLRETGEEEGERHVAPRGKGSKHRFPVL